MFNEAAHIDRLIADIAGQDYDGEVEVLVADGASTDGSLDRLRCRERPTGSGRHGPRQPGPLGLSCPEPLRPRR